MTTLQSIQTMKRGNLYAQAFLEIPTPEGIKAYLRPVRINGEDAAKMAKWRTKAFQSFFTWIKPSENDILRWLKDYENNDNDIIFIIEIKPGISVGQLSLYNIAPYRDSAELGRVIRGEKRGHKAIMALAIRTLLQWAFNSLKLKRISLEIFADNKSALFLYKHLGFQIVDTVFFHKTINQEGIMQWVEVKGKKITPACGRHQYRKVYKMALTGKTFNLFTKPNLIRKKIK